MCMSCADTSVLELRKNTHTAHGSFFELIIKNPSWKNIKAGQFLMLRPKSWKHSPLLARPFSISYANNEYISIFIQEVAYGTELIAKLQEKDTVTVWGPLGNGFTVDENIPTLLAAGGIGIAPFRYYLSLRKKLQDVSLIFAHRGSVENYLWDSFKDLIPCTHLEETCAQDIPTIIGSIEQVIENFPKNGKILCCGPTPFMKTVQKAAIKADIFCELSLESHMACGVGACLGCVVKDTNEKHICSCTKGPVFQAKDIIL